MEFLSLIDAVATQLNAQKIELVCDMLEKLIVIGDQLESAVQKGIITSIPSLAKQQPESPAVPPAA